MKSLAVIRHVAFEDLDAWTAPFQAAGYALTYHDAGVADLASFDSLAPDLLVVLGGPLGVHDAADYPFLCDEIRLLQDRLAARRPVLGICLGAQLLVHALGGHVQPNRAREVGWQPVRLTGVGQRSPLRHLENLPVFHWHSDAFDLPPGAEALASTPACPCQAFALDNYALGLQFHPEVSAANLERWYICNVRELHSHPQPTVAQLRAAAAQHAPTMQAAARTMLEEWLAGLPRLGA